MAILVIAAHPDDEVLMVGGTIAKVAEAGGNVVVAIANKNGAASRRAIRVVADDSKLRPDPSTFPNYIDSLVESTKLAMEVLAGDGPTPIVEVAEFPQLELECVGHLPVTHWVENLIAKHDATTVITHNQFSLNNDHRICYGAAVAATRPTKDRLIHLYCGEVPGDNWGPFKPNCYSNLTRTLLFRKALAMAAYRYELQPSPHPRSIDGIEHLACLRGSEAGMDCAEAFMVERAKLLI